VAKENDNLPPVEVEGVDDAVESVHRGPGHVKHLERRDFDTVLTDVIC
jgi:hypothetical protein